MKSSWLKSTCAVLIVYSFVCMGSAKESRHCYDCVYQQATKSWGPCEGPIAESAYSIVDAPLCPTNCFIKVEPNGDIRRGCYDGTYGIDETLLGCHIQGPHASLYCFCEGGRCNGEAAPDYTDQDHKLKVHEDHNLHQNSPPFKTEERTSHSVAGRQGHPSKGSRSFLPTVAESLKPNSHLYDNRREGENNNEHKHRQRTDKNKVSYDVVYGIDTQPQIYNSPHLKQPISATKRQRNYEHSDLDNFEHAVDVQTKKETKGHTNDIDIHRKSDGSYDITQHENDGVNREYVDHVQRQRELKTTHHVGDNFDTLANLLPGSHLSDPEVEHKKTQHFHKYNVGERTIEHHIVEHYVLHHRIKELIKDIQGIDAKNIDPRQASLIYRLLHPDKAAKLDAQSSAVVE